MALKITACHIYRKITVIIPPDCRQSSQKITACHINTRNNRSLQISYKRIIGKQRYRCPGAVLYPKDSVFQNSCASPKFTSWTFVLSLQCPITRNTILFHYHRCQIPQNWRVAKPDVTCVPRLVYSVYLLISDTEKM